MEKKILLNILSLFMLLGLVGCSQPESIDEQFISDFKEGLSERWEATEINEDENTIEAWEGYLNSELSHIKKYQNSTFENKELKNLCKNYIEVLNNSYDLIKYVESDYNRFWSEYQPYYDERTVLIKKINDIVPLEFEKKDDQKSLEGLLNDSELVIAINDIISKTDFKLNKKESFSSYKLYETTVENSSPFNFSHFSFNINLVDKNGVVVETNFSNTSNWESKTKHVFEFSTSKSFDKIEIKSADYTL